MKQKLKLCLQLFLTFMKIGAVTFGGGYAMIPIIENEISVKKGWINGDDLLEVVAISETTPGPIAICAATFIGYRIGGILGAFCATLSSSMSSRCFCADLKNSKLSNTPSSESARACWRC